MAFIQDRLENRVLRLHFSDPATRNALSLKAADELRALLARHNGQFDFLVLTAEGRVFCSGGNLADYASMPKSQEGIEVNRKITSALDELAQVPAVSIALVTGDCFGGGVELLSSFDYIYSAPHSFFGLWQRKIGLSFGWGGGARLEKRLGTQLLKAWALATDSHDAFEAREAGLVDRVCPLAHLEDQALKLIERQKQLPRQPLSSLKRWVSADEQKIFENLWWNDEHKRVLTKFKK